MKNYNNQGSIDSIETFGLVDGPGIRTVIFLNNCLLRCKFCHNPEMWTLKDKNYTSGDLFQKIIRNKSYFKNNGGVTFSGGEPLLQSDFLIDLCKKLKKENIHIALDTSGISNNIDNKELLNLVDLVLLDIKHITKKGFMEITQKDEFEKYLAFIKELNKLNKEIWIRQVIIPDVNDNEEYITELSSFIKNNIKNVTRIDFLPYHTLAKEKYKKLGIKNPYQNKKEMSKEKVEYLYKKFKEIYEKD